MSTFAVFGMTLPEAKSIARKKIYNKKQSQKTETEIEQQIGELAAEIFAGKDIVCLTRKFDSPDFARDWIELAKRTTECRNLGIRQYAKTGELTKSGAPKKAWSDLT